MGRQKVGQVEGPKSKDEMVDPPDPVRYVGGARIQGKRHFVQYYHSQSIPTFLSHSSVPRESCRGPRTPHSRYETMFTSVNVKRVKRVENGGDTEETTSFRDYPGTSRSRRHVLVWTLTYQEFSLGRVDGAPRLYVRKKQRRRVTETRENRGTPEGVPPRKGPEGGGEDVRGGSSVPLVRLSVQSSAVED